MMYYVKLDVAYRGSTGKLVYYEVEAETRSEALEMARQQFEDDGEPGRVRKAELVQKEDVPRNALT